VSAAIVVTGVAKTFGSIRGGATAALGPIDLSIDRGQVVTLLGPSGSGKTTLLRLIAGLEQPTDGTISVEGSTPDAARRAKRIGLVPQSPTLLPWRTVGANARLLRDVNTRANRSDQPDPADLLDEVGLAAFADAYPHELSGGMQQRVALVRAFAVAPSVLLLDEPFAALDEISRTDARHLLATMCEHHSTTVVFVTHSIAEAVYLSERVIVLTPRPGRVVAEEAVSFARPRLPAIEDTPEFFAVETELRAALRESADR
jgi:NitT/TauT family transport system ATP-binding protein